MADTPDEQRRLEFNMKIGDYEYIVHLFVKNNLNDFYWIYVYDSQTDIKVFREGAPTLPEIFESLLTFVKGRNEILDETKNVKEQVKDFFEKHNIKGKIKE
jgi:hypothetical protein